jgi:hypothetical protein
MLSLLSTLWLQVEVEAAVGLFTEVEGVAQEVF